MPLFLFCERRYHHRLKHQSEATTAEIPYPSVPYGGPKTTRCQDPGELRRVAIGLGGAEDLLPLLSAEFDFDVEIFNEKWTNWSKLFGPHSYEVEHSTYSTEDSRSMLLAMLRLIETLPGAQDAPSTAQEFIAPEDNPHALSLWDPEYDDSFLALKERTRERWKAMDQTTNSSAGLSQPNWDAQNPQSAE